MSVRRMSLARAVIAAAAMATLGLTGCVPAEPTAAAPGGFVQDLWIFDQIVAVNADDEPTELTEAIAAEFADIEPDNSVELMDGVTFHEYAALSPQIVDTDIDAAKARADVGMTAGFIETKDGRNLSILATPDPATRNPIYFKDLVKFDLSFLSGTITPGDPLLYDYAFAQAIPTLDAVEAGLDNLELLSHRMRAKSVQYYGEEVDGEPVAMTYKQQLGLVLEGSEWATFPPKSQDMMDGFEAGAKECAKKTRGTPLQCVENFLTEFFDGVRGSWEMIDEQMTYAETEVLEKRKEAALERTHDRKKPAKKERECGADASQSDEEKTGGANGGGSCTPPQGGSPATVSGDPHFRTFDGRQYSMQGVGEYLAASHESLTVQIRTHPAMQSVTSLSAVALGFGDHAVMIEAAELHVDGKPVTDAVIELDGARIENRHHIVTVEFDNGQLVRVVNSWGWALDLEIWNPLAGEWAGMLGDADGDPDNDLFTRDGRMFTDDLTFDQLYQEYSESWRVSQQESLFHYGSGDDTETFTDRSMPAEEVTVLTLPTQHREQAERICRAADIADPVVFDNCVLDYALLGALDDPTVPGELAAVRSAVTADKIEAYVSGKVDTLGARVPPRDSEETRENSEFEWKEPTVADPASWLVTGNQLLGDTKPRDSMMCSADGEPGPLWGGNGGYSMDSSVCTAAVHSGGISHDKGGFIMVQRAEEVGATVDFSSFDDFPAYTSGGMTSKSKPAGPAFYFG